MAQTYLSAIYIPLNVININMIAKPAESKVSAGFHTKININKEYK
jgi:hypothetical protein